MENTKAFEKLIETLNNIFTVPAMDETDNEINVFDGQVKEYVNDGKLAVDGVVYEYLNGYYGYDNDTFEELRSAIETYFVEQGFEYFEKESYSILTGAK